MHGVFAQHSALVLLLPAAGAHARHCPPTTRLLPAHCLATATGPAAHSQVGQADLAARQSMQQHAAELRELEAAQQPPAQQALAHCPQPLHRS